MTYLTYIPDLNTKYMVVGSVGRKTHHKKLMELFNKYSDTIPKLLEKDYKMPETKHDIDLLTSGDIKELAEQYKNILVSPKTLTPQSDILTLKRTDDKLPKVKQYNLFVAPTKEQLPFYFLYSLLGELINIIMRVKVHQKNLKLNRHGLFKGNSPVKLNFKDDLFSDLEEIIRYIYS